MMVDRLGVTREDQSALSMPKMPIRSGTRCMQGLIASKIRVRAHWCGQTMSVLFDGFMLYWK